MNRKYLNIILNILLFTYVSIHASNSYTIGVSWYNKRHDYKNENIMPIDSAILYFSKAYSESTSLKNTGELLLKSYYFKASYIVKDKARKEEVYLEGINVGKELLKKNFANAGIYYWQAMLWGRWGELCGVVPAVRERIPSKVKDLLSMSIKNDSTWDEGRAYITMGRLHQKAPKIPVVLKWPSKDTAYFYFKKAYSYNPNRKETILYLADYYYEEKKYNKAISSLNSIINSEPLPNEYIEDMYIINDAKKLLKKIKNK